VVQKAPGLNPKQNFRTNSLKRGNKWGGPERIDENNTTGGGRRMNYLRTSKIMNRIKAQDAGRTGVKKKFGL